MWATSLVSAHLSHFQYRRSLALVNNFLFVEATISPSYRLCNFLNSHPSSSTHTLEHQKRPSIPYVCARTRQPTRQLQKVSAAPALTMLDETPDGHPTLKEAVIISMLGGPGSGKGTQCQMLSQKFDFAHISIGDVLRQEINRPGSQYADILQENIMAGRIGAKEMTVSILRDEMLRIAAQGTRCFVLDGVFVLCMQYEAG